MWIDFESFLEMRGQWPVAPPTAAADKKLGMVELAAPLGQEKQLQLLVRPPPTSAHCNGMKKI